LEVITFIWESAWDFLMIFIGLISMIFGFKEFQKVKKLKESGIKTIATVVDFSYEENSDGNTLKIPVFEFYDNLNNNIRVKGVSNSICKINETTVVYYDSKNPQTEFYFPKKDFSVKYLFTFLGLFFFTLGLIYLYRHFMVLNSK
jgi:hypothetical protein